MLSQQPYRTLKTSFGLADEALPHTDGVDYVIDVSVDSGRSFTELVHVAVTTNTWRSALVGLPPSKELVLRLSASGRQDDAYDWLQVKVDLLPLDGGYETAASVAEAGMME